jgi:AcrR family transcriptional regulator
MPGNKRVFPSIRMEPTLPPDHAFWGVAPFQKAPPEQVAETQRRRLLLGITRVVARKGYGAANVADVLREVRISRRTFYELFRGKEDCYLAAYAQAHAAIVAAIKDSQRGIRDPLERFEAAHRAFLGVIEQQPDVARAFLVGILEAGPRATEQRTQADLEFADMHVELHRQCRERFPELPAVPRRAFVALTAGTNLVVIDELRRHGAARVMALLPDVLYLSYSVYGLHAQAAAQLRPAAQDSRI